MRVFISAPFTHGWDKNFLRSVAGILEEAGHETVIPHEHVGKYEDTLEDVRNNFRLLDGCDAVLAEVSEPSHGVGAEIWHAFRENKKIFLFKRNGSKVSDVASIYAESVIEYDAIDDLKEKLTSLPGP